MSTPEKEPMPDGLLQRMIQAQIGTPAESNLIEEHMEEYFKRWPSYRNKLTNLEWYHLFLDFLDKINVSRIPSVQSKEYTEVPEEKLDKPISLRDLLPTRASSDVQPIEGEQKRRPLASEFKRIITEEVWINFPACDKTVHNEMPELRDIDDAANACAEYAEEFYNPEAQSIADKEVREATEIEKFLEKELSTQVIQIAGLLASNKECEGQYKKYVLDLLEAHKQIAVYRKGLEEIVRTYGHYTPGPLGNHLYNIVTEYLAKYPSPTLTDNKQQL